MTQEQFYDLLTTTGYDVAYYQFETTPETPYVVYFFINSSNFGADNKVFKSFSNFQVELYTDKKDKVAETAIENVFDSANIYWEKSENFINTEKLYQIIYTVQI